MCVFMHVMNGKPFGVPPTLFWTLDLVAWGLGLVAWCLGPDFGVGLVLEGFGLEVYTIIMLGAICYADETCVYVLGAWILAMCYVLCAWICQICEVLNLHMFYTLL